MIRKLARIDAPIAVVHEMFRDTDRWPQWMPGIASTRTLSGSPAKRIVEVVHLVRGRRVVQKLECRDAGGNLEHRQVEGWFRKWEADWAFSRPPEAPGQKTPGTTVSLQLAVELGMAGVLVPKRFFRGWMNRMLDQTIRKARSRAPKLIVREPTQAVRLGEPILQVFETPDGFEVHFAGRTFHIDSWDQLG